MIEVNNELTFNGNNGTYFEAYMFVTTPKHIARHTDFSDMEISVMCDGVDTSTRLKSWDSLDSLSINQPYRQVYI